ncbi:class I SAM-dependent methyltransferase [Kribbella capetownensis]|uniref:Class I SAM-dependent methyltransferase n=1 Tax=Kribbella capetownensis TaxID=1572659 RepID=A0A4R0JFT6_9ACTN|nr:class I SAM-dependent methyltransferase [Kribbella capetownensis]TCC45711.1 class I SAM-dependent methyltransferase [Kribbella capetownensis]
MSELADYYRDRAAEYDAVYDKPERQQDLATLKELLPPLVAGKRVLEIAAGTGYWTQVLAESAQSIVATDLNDETLAIARSRSYSSEVSFQVADAFRLDEIAGEYDVVFTGFFWSHVLRQDTARFAQSLVQRAERVVLVDNKYVAGSNYPISRTTADGDTYQTRQLTDGRTYDVLKNFPTTEQFRADMAPADVTWTDLTYFWLATVTG